jgi:hypothetical protein
MAEEMTFYCKTCTKKMIHRGSKFYYCGTCRKTHIIEKWTGPDGKPLYIEDPHTITREEAMRMANGEKVQLI